RPKCLVEIGDGISIIEQQLLAIDRAGQMDGVLLVLGYRAAMVEAKLSSLHLRTAVEVVYNPFFDESNALVSLWLAMQRRPTDFVVINGDVVFSPRCLQTLAAATDQESVLLLASRKAAFGVDAVKVVAFGNRLRRIGKELAVDETTGESAGLVRFRGDGATAAILTIERMLRQRESRNGFWYTLLGRMIDDRFPIHVRECSPDDWFEVDYRGDGGDDRDGRGPDAAGLRPSAAGMGRAGRAARPSLTLPLLGMEPALVGPLRHRQAAPTPALQSRPFADRDRPVLRAADPAGG